MPVDPDVPLGQQGSGQQGSERFVKSFCPRFCPQAELLARDGRRHALALVVDTGNPCEVIIDIATMLMMEWREAGLGF